MVPCSDASWSASASFASTISVTRSRLPRPSIDRVPSSAFSSGSLPTVSCSTAKTSMRSNRVVDTAVPTSLLPNRNEAITSTIEPGYNRPRRLDASDNPTVTARLPCGRIPASCTPAPDLGKQAAVNACPSFTGTERTRPVTWVGSLKAPAGASRARMVRVVIAELSSIEADGRSRAATSTVTSLVCGSSNGRTSGRARSVMIRIAAASAAPTPSTNKMTMLMTTLMALPSASRGPKRLVHVPRHRHGSLQRLRTRKQGQIHDRQVPVRHRHRHRDQRPRRRPFHGLLR